jgi:hypothetical protein
MECLDGEEIESTVAETSQVKSVVKLEQKEKKCEKCKSEVCKC